MTTRRPTRFDRFYDRLADAATVAINRDGVRLGSAPHRSPLDCADAEFRYRSVDSLAEEWGIPRIAAYAFLTGWHGVRCTHYKAKFGQYLALGIAYRKRFILNTEHST